MQVLRKLKLPNSLRAKMLLWAFVFVVPILAILYATIWTAAESFETQTRGSINQTLTPYSADIDATLASAKLYIANLRVDLSLLSESAQQTPSGLQALNSLAEDISEDMALYPQIDAFFLYRDGSLRFLQNYNRSYTESRTAALALQDRLDGLGADAQIFQEGYLYFEAGGNFYLYIATNVRDGVMGCWFSVDSLFENIQSADLLGLTHIMLSDRQGRLLNREFDTRSSRQLAQLLEPYLVTRTSLSAAPFNIIVLWDEGAVLAPVWQMHQSMLAAITFACVLFVLYMLFLRASLVRPLNRLAGAIDGIRSGNLAPIPIRRSDGLEIENVYHALNAMTSQIESLKIQMYEEKLVKQQTQMQLFQLQIRPHFLLNALNTIVSFARIKDYDMVQKMTMYLASHCQYILYNPWYVTLEEELVYTQNFIDMQSAQHDARYRYTVRVEDELLDYEIPILGIQIFVENALKHARGLDRPMEILVQIDESVLNGAHYLRIAIEDNGDGFSPSALAELNRPEIPVPDGDDRGIGIANVRQRLKILYNDRAWVRFSNRNDSGAQVEMFLPLDWKGGNRL